MVLLALALLTGCEEEIVVDRDCDTRSVFYVDGDGDGFGDPLQLVLACAGSDGLSSNPDDCDDTDPSQTTVCEDLDTGDTASPDTGSSRSGTQDTDTSDTDTRPTGGDTGDGTVPSDSGDLTEPDDTATGTTTEPDDTATGTDTPSSSDTGSEDTSTAPGDGA